MLYTVTANPLEMPLKKRRVHQGTNRSDVFGPIACPPLTAEHHNMVTWEEKKYVECRLQALLPGRRPRP
ncbi:MAG: hypothetical protein GY772_27970, partial [bacterium]|nr:hypothetical protein [bacterium]